MFNSKDRTEIEIALQNGFFSSSCKGTVWFSDFKFEKKDMTPSTDWHFLCLIFKSIDVTVEFKEKKDYRRKAEFSPADTAEITRILKRVPRSFKEISNNMMEVSRMDIITVEEPLSVLTGKYGEGYFIDPKDIKGTLDDYLDRETYNQIIVVAPLGELANWFGIGGMFYRSEIGFCQVSMNPGYKPFHPFEDAVFIHEVLHCLESRAKGNFRKVANLHDSGTGKYGLPYSEGKNEWIEWYRAYMRNTLPDKMGLTPEVYTVYNSTEYTLISNDME